MGISFCNVSRSTGHDPTATGRFGEHHHIKHLSVGREQAPTLRYCISAVFDKMYKNKGMGLSD